LQLLQACKYFFFLARVNSPFLKQGRHLRHQNTITKMITIIKARSKTDKPGLSDNEFRPDIGIPRDGGLGIYCYLINYLSITYNKYQWCFTEKSTTKAPAKHHKSLTLALQKATVQHHISTKGHQ
jgi:hypothetical protein